MKDFCVSEMIIETNNVDNLTDADIDITVTRLKAFVINDKNEILVAFAAGGCQLPGGHLEDGEKLADGLIREIKEETGISLDDKDKVCAFYIKKYFKKNYENTNKNRLSQIIYYIIHTNKSPDFSKLQLTKRERENNFNIKSVSIKDFESYVKSFLTDEQTEMNIAIIKELLKVFPYFIQKINN